MYSNDTISTVMTILTDCPLSYSRSFPRESDDYILHQLLLCSFLYSA